MGFLNPLFLFALAAVAVPLFLHLFHRQETERVAFPALRYLKRTEKDHARRIRLRQLLLMLLRVAALLLLVGAGARTFLTGSSRAHPPTALAIVLDNSASSGLVLEDERVLDHLKRAALASLRDATDRDQVWVIRAGEADDFAPRSSPEEGRLRVADTDVAETGANLDEALRTAEALVLSSELEVKEIHLISDLQASAFPEEATALGVPVRALAPAWDVPTNRAVGDVLVGGGLPPVTGQRTEISAAVTGPASAFGDSVPVRLILDGQVAGATVAPIGATVVFPVPPLAPGVVEGHVEVDPDALAADDRRHFVFRAGAPPRVEVRGSVSPFLASAVEVLIDDGRIRRDRPAELVVSVDGEGLESRQPTQAFLVVPSGDPNRIGALNRRLSAADVPWQFGETTAGEFTVESELLPHDLTDVGVFRRYALTGGRGGVLALSGGAPWIVRAGGGRGPTLLWASALTPDATDLVTGTLLVPLLEWLIGSSSGGGDRARTDLAVGAPLPLDPTVTAVTDPEGRVVPLDEGRAYTRRAGLHSLLSGDSVVARVAVNIPAAESPLERAEVQSLQRLYGPGFEVVPRDGWEQGIFSVRQGPEVWWPLVLGALLCLLLESWIAASGLRQERRSPTPATNATR